MALELGGKSANIVLDDADFAAVIPKGVFACFLNSGQTCTAHTRMLVPNSRYDEAVEIAAAAVATTQVDDPTKEGMHLGPLISQAQWDRVQSYIQKGIDEGAVVAAGGLGKPEGYETGYFVKPTLFANVSNDMTIAQEEIFGPVLSIIGYADDDDAVRIANDSLYGLSGGVWSADQDRAMSVARRGCRWQCAPVLLTSMVEVSTLPPPSAALSNPATVARTARTASKNSSRRSRCNAESGLGKEGE